MRSPPSPGPRAVTSYEGQAAAELEGIADPAEARGDGYEVPLIHDGDAPLLLDARAAIRTVLDDVGRGTPSATVSARFHAGLAVATAAACARIAPSRGIGSVVLAGGVFQNRLLLERTRSALADAGFEVLVPVALPPNDGGIAYGQAAVAAARAAGPRW